MKGIIGQSSKIQAIRNTIRDVADSMASVLIIGETGTGKDLAARTIHNEGPRRHNPFIVAHCGSYCQNLIASELFGHEKGAYTGANGRGVGRFERAHRGTLFIDEIGSIPKETQVLLLRVLEEKSFERVGGEKRVETDVRIIAATNKNLHEEVAAGRFRRDLYYRLNVINIFIPPLRERRQDIPLLVEHFIKKFNIIENKFVKGVSHRAMDVLLHYSWPGNIRELQSQINRAIVFTKGKIIHEDAFSFESGEDGFDTGGTLVDHEKMLISSTLRACHWNKHEVSRRLGIHRATLYSKIKRYGLSPQ